MNALNVEREDEKEMVENTSTLRGWEYVSVRHEMEDNKSFRKPKGNMKREGTEKEKERKKVS